MRLTRHIHSCIELSDATSRIIIDPGCFGAPDDLANTDAILITHIHPDHLDPAAIAAARAENPALRIIGPAEVATTFGEQLGKVEVATAGTALELGTLQATVRAPAHEVVAHCLPRAQNLSYLIGDLLHPGDSLDRLAEVDTILLPIAGPWLKMLDIEEYFAAVQPRQVIGIHDDLLSANGLAVHHGIISQLADAAGIEYLALSPGDSIELSA